MVGRIQRPQTLHIYIFRQYPATAASHFFSFLDYFNFANDFAKEVAEHTLVQELPSYYFVAAETNGLGEKNSLKMMENHNGF